MLRTLGTTGDRMPDKEDALSRSDLQAQITAAKAYEEFFAPALIGEWAPRVAATGTVACEIAAHLVTGTRS